VENDEFKRAMSHSLPSQHIFKVIFIFFAQNDNNSMCEFG